MDIEIMFSLYDKNNKGNSYLKKIKKKERESFKVVWSGVTMNN